MGRSFVQVEICSNKYKLYVQDIKKIYKHHRKNRPPIPAFEDNPQTPKTSLKQ